MTLARHVNAIAWPVLAGVILIAPRPAQARQGTLQVVGAAQAVSGEIPLGAHLQPIEPDFGVKWEAPTARLGTIQLEMRGTERGGKAHLGRMYAAARDAKIGGWKWTFEAGDAYYSPFIGSYKFANLTTPSVTYVGAAVGARSARTEAGVVVGAGTAWRNIFGNDADTLDQSILGGYITRHASDRLDITARASRIRNRDLDEFTSSISASDQTGGALRYIVTPAVHVIADGAAVRYRRVGAAATETDGSGLIGVHWLHARGWLQANISRFSPGESPTINSPLSDRAGQFVSGEFDVLRRLRVFGSWEDYRSNLDPSAASAAGRSVPRTSGTRQSGGLRAMFGPRSALTLRAESGDRISKYDATRLDVQSDTGGLSADFQTTVGRLNGFLRAAQRENVMSTSRSGTFTQREVSSQVFYRVSTKTQFFGLAMTTRTTDAEGGGTTFWQAGGGAQLQLVDRGLWFRTEASASRNADLLSRLFQPRESLNIGLNGYIAQRTTVGFDVYLDRGLQTQTDGGSWTTRSMVRVTQSLATGSPFAARPSASAPFRTVPARALATVRGTVYADWNGNGLRDAGEDAVARVPLRIEASGAVESGANGEFVFKNVPDGLHDVAIDTRSLPVDFDPPRIPRVQLSLSGKDTREVSFGIVPLGRIRGRVVRDLNGNGSADPDEPAIDDAVVVLDDGIRSERAKRGAFAFEAVPAGEHAVTLLSDSLPDASIIAGATTKEATLQRNRMAIELEFLVSTVKRAEVRRVFSGSPSLTRPAVERPPVTTSPASPTQRLARAPESRAPLRTGDRSFVLQVAAFDDPLRAQKLVAVLAESGFAAYLVAPPPDNPNAPYRVRVGTFGTRGEAEGAATAVTRAVGQKPWITRE